MSSQLQSLCQQCCLCDQKSRLCSMHTSDSWRWGTLTLFSSVTNSIVAEIEGLWGNNRVLGLICAHIPIATATIGVDGPPSPLYILHFLLLILHFRNPPARS